MSPSWGRAYSDSNDMKQEHIAQQLGAEGTSNIFGCWTASEIKWRHKTDVFFVRSGLTSSITRQPIKELPQSLWAALCDAVERCAFSNFKPRIMRDSCSWTIHEPFASPALYREQMALITKFISNQMSKQTSTVHGIYKQQTLGMCTVKLRLN